jgi:hypothetical protein
VPGHALTGGTVLPSRSHRPRLAAALTALAAMLTLAVPAAAAAPNTAAHDVPLRVMSYNIFHGAGSDNVFDLDRTAATIQAQHPDIVGLQEVDQTWDARSNFVDEPAALAKALHMSVFFGAIYDLPPLTEGAPDRRYGVAILSRYPIVHAVDHEITRLSTQDPNPVPAPAPGFPRPWSTWTARSCTSSTLTWTTAPTRPCGQCRSPTQCGSCMRPAVSRSLSETST